MYSKRISTVILSLFALVLGFAAFSSEAKAAYFVMSCANNNTSNIPGFKINKGGSAYNVVNKCTSGTQTYPAQSESFLRIATNGTGKIKGGYPSFSWTAPSSSIKFKRFRSIYTREDQMAAGWRHQIIGTKNGQDKTLMYICTGCSNGGIGKNRTPIFTLRANTWNLGKDANTLFDKLRVTVTCTASGGCQRSPQSRMDINSFVFQMQDTSKPALSAVTSPLIDGTAIGGTQPINFSGTDVGAGMSYGQITVDGKSAGITTKNAGCDIFDYKLVTYGKNFKPCPNNFPNKSISLDTTKYSDGNHVLGVCLFDFSGNKTCKNYNVKWVNSPLKAPVIVIHPNNPSNNNNPKFVFNGVKDAKYFCKVNKRKWGRCAKTFKPKNLPEGRNIIQVYQVDSFNRTSPVTSFVWYIKPYKCTLKKYSAKLTPRGLKINMVGIRKRLVRYRLFPRNFNLQKIKNDSPAVAREQLWGWRRTTFTNRNRSVLIRPYGFNFNGAIRKYVRKQKVAKLVVTVANESQRCNNYNINKRTKYLRFTPRIIRGLGLNR